MTFISQSYIDDATDEELLERIQSLANEVDGMLHDADWSHDYLSSLCCVADALRERLYDRWMSKYKE